MSKAQVNFVNDLEESHETPRYIYVLIAAAVLVVTATISYSSYLGNRSANYYSPLIDAAHEIRISSALAHLWVDEVLDNDPDIRVEDIMALYDQAYGYTTAMLGGGKIHKKTVSAINDVELIKILKLTQEKITYIRKMTENRLVLKHEAIVGIDISRVFDLAFAELLESSTKVEKRLITVMDREMTLFRSIESALILSCILGGFIAGIAIFKFNRRRAGYILAIQEKNRQLQDMNQTLAVTEQQLRATNQQLMASEQQMNASNQQLLAHEQQLKATNQQLMANEQQLKAFNQQLLANEQQLRATNQQLLASEQALRKSEIRYRSLFNDMTEGVAIHRVIYDEKSAPVNYEIINVNPQYEIILNIPREQVVGKLATEAYGVPEPPYLSEYANVAETGNPYRLEIYFPPMKKHFDISVSSFEKGYFVTIFLDITKRKKAESDRIRLNKELVQKNRELEQVVYVTSHDLRSPLVNIEGYSGIFGDSLKEIITILNNDGVSSETRNRLASYIKDSSKSIEYISDSVSRMDALLNGLLNFSRSGRVELKKEELDMNNIISAVISSFRYKAEETGTKLEIYELPGCVGDKEQIIQMFSNMIGNALKYLDAERPGLISVSGHIEEGRSIYCVEDNGIGIAPEYNDKIFEIFHQLQPKAGGEGLGLTIVLKIVERHNGKIWVESEPGRGSKFYVSL